MAKGHICDSGLIEPLLMFLAPHGDTHLAQLAALALRNLSRHTPSKTEIMKHDGVNMLLSFLSEGLENLQYPLHCDVCSCDWAMYLLDNLSLTLSMLSVPAERPNELSGIYGDRPHK